MMIQLDHHLLFQARRLITSADVHRAKEMIFVYEQAVDLDNRQHPSRRVYPREHEGRLRCYVNQRCIEQLERTIIAVRHYRGGLSETAPTV
jgi:hypothetical protein